MRTELVIAVSFMLSAASAAAIVFVLLKKAGLLARSRFTAQASALLHHPANASAPDSAATVHTRAEQEAPAETPGPFIEGEAVVSASPYAVDDDTETPEAALTMNLINKKREAKKETIRDVMRRVHRRENPRRIAEALHVGIGEVDLAVTMMKLKK